MFQELLKTQLHLVIGYVIGCTIVGIVLGALLALFVFFLSTRKGAFESGWKHDKWLRVVTALWMIGTFVVLGGSIGGCEGALWGTERLVEKSQIRSEGLRRASTFAATGLIVADFYLGNEEAGRKSGLTADQRRVVEAFLEGQHEFDIAAFVERLKRAETRLIYEHLPEIIDRLRSRLALPESETLDATMTLALEALLRRMIREDLGGELEQYGAQVDGFFASLPSAAAVEGDPKLISSKELSVHLEETILIPLIMKPARGFVRSQQAALLLLMAGAWVLPMLGFWIGRTVRRSHASARSDVTDAGEPEGDSR